MSEQADTTSVSTEMDFHASDCNVVNLSQYRHISIGFV